MKDNIRLIVTAAVMCGIYLGTAHMAYKAGHSQGYASGHYAGRTEACAPIETAPVEEFETAYNWYYLRGSTVTDEGGQLGYGITFPDTNEARRFIHTLLIMQQTYKPQE